MKKYYGLKEERAVVATVRTSAILKDRISDKKVVENSIANRYSKMPPQYSLMARHQKTQQSLVSLPKATVASKSTYFSKKNE